MTILILIVVVLMMLWCYHIAKKNGRNVVLATAMGFLFGIFAVIVYAFMGETEAKKVERIRNTVK